MRCFFSDSLNKWKAGGKLQNLLCFEGKNYTHLLASQAHIRRHFTLGKTFNNNYIGSKSLQSWIKMLWVQLSILQALIPQLKFPRLQIKDNDAPIWLASWSSRVKKNMVSVRSGEWGKIPAPRSPISSHQTSIFSSLLWRQSHLPQRPAAKN